MASYLIHQCVAESGGIGGFVTYGLANMIDYVLNPMIAIDNIMGYRKTYSCMTKYLKADTDGHWNF